MPVVTIPAAAQGAAPISAAPSTPGAPVHLDATAGVVVSAGVAPAPAVGAALGIMAQWREASVSLEGRFDAPSSAQARGGAVSSSLALLTLAPCGHLGPAFGCALVQGGQLHAEGDALGGSEQSAAWWAVGGRIGVAIPLGGGRTSLRLRSDILANLEPQTLELNQSQAWKAPGVAGSLGLDIIFHFR